MSNVAAVLADGRIYFVLYAWLAAAMLIEIFFEEEVFSRWLARFGMTLIVVFIGLRWQTGTDWLAYLRIFYTLDTSSDYDSVVFGIDQGYIIFNRIMYALSNSYSLFLLVDAAIAIGAVYWFIEKSTKLPNMGVYLFYTSYAVTHFMGSNRRMLAIGFVCLGFLALAKERPLRRNWGRWTVPFGIAATLHRTSLAALPAMIVSRRAWGTFWVVAGLLVSLAIGMSGVAIVALKALGGFLSEYAGFTAVEKLLYYTSGEAELDTTINVMQQAVLGVAKRSTALVVFISYMHFVKPSQYAQRLFNIYIIGCALYFAMIGAPIFQVISTYYSIVEIVLFPLILSDLPRLKVPYSAYLLIVPFLLLLSALSPYVHLYVPYESVFSSY